MKVLQEVRFHASANVSELKEYHTHCTAPFPSVCYLLTMLLFVVYHKTTAGESERVLHQLFDDAKKTKPSIIFLDELDALVRQASGGSRTLQLGQCNSETSRRL